RAVVHNMAAALLSAEGRWGDSESEYLAALRAWEQEGGGDTADAGAILNSLGSLYVQERRFDEADLVLDRALSIFDHAEDAVPRDRINLLNPRGLLHARRGEWREAEEDLRDALSVADREPWLDPVDLRSLLTNYARVLRKNHRRQAALTIEARIAVL